jgi:hypothetical protein
MKRLLCVLIFCVTGVGAFAQETEAQDDTEKDQIKKYDIFNQTRIIEEEAQRQRQTMSGGSPDFARMRREKYQRVQEGVRQHVERAERHRREDAEIREKWGAKGFYGLDTSDYNFLEQSLPVIDSYPPEQKQAIMERLTEASVYSRRLNLPIDTTYENLEAIRKKWTEQQVVVKKSGLEAVIDGLGSPFVSLAFIVITVLLIAGLCTKAIKKRRRTE